MSTEAELVRTPTHRVKNLDSLTGVRAEMVNVYRLARKGSMETGDMARFIFALRQIAQVIERTDVVTYLAGLSDDELLTLITEKIDRMEGRTPRPETASSNGNGTRPHSG